MPCRSLVSERQSGGVALQNYYQILGVNPSASAQEIRRAYRILARRYHPDVNPGHASEERFKQIAAAYRVLNDPDRRAKFDAELGASAYERIRRGQAAYQRQQAQAARRATATERFYRTRPDLFGKLAAEEEERPAESPKARAPSRGESLVSTAKRAWLALRDLLPQGDAKAIKKHIRKVSILEVSVTMREAIIGAKKVVEIPEDEGPRKVSVRIPPGARTGSVLRLRRPGDESEELVFFLRVNSHPFLNILARGLVVELPVSPAEAISGTSISVPTLSEPAILAIPPGSQSGSELRLRGQGITLPDGSRGDLFYRLIVRVPTCHQAVGIGQLATELDRYLEQPVRSDLPSSLLEGLS